MIVATKIVLGITCKVAIRQTFVSRKRSCIQRIIFETHLSADRVQERRNGEIGSRRPGKIREFLRCNQRQEAARRSTSGRGSVRIGREFELACLPSRRVEKDEHGSRVHAIRRSPSILSRCLLLDDNELDLRVAIRASHHFLDVNIMVSCANAALKEPENNCNRHYNRTNV